MMQPINSILQFSRLLKYHKSYRNLLSETFICTYRDKFHNQTAIKEAREGLD